MIESGAPRAVFEELTDSSALVEGYRALARPPQSEMSDARDAPLVSIVIPYFKLDRYLRETLESAAAQTHPAIEIVIVNDGSLRSEDRVVYELAEEFGARVVTQVNSGLGAARNFGIAQSRGRYVLPLDADDTIAPEFVARCVHALEANESLAYVTSWVEYMDPSGRPASDENGGYFPFGNWSELMERNNVGGTCVALIRRSSLRERLCIQHRPHQLRGLVAIPRAPPRRPSRRRDPRATDPVPGPRGVDDAHGRRTAPRAPLRRAQGPSAGAPDQLDRSRPGVGWMAVDQQTHSRPRTGRMVGRVPAEIIGYVVLAIGLAALLWSRIGDVDGFYLDEWIYVHGSEYIWEHLPGGLVDQIPFWDRGVQRLYSTLLAPLWGPLPTSTAYTSAHVLNVILLVSAIVPTALLARLVIDAPALRVLAVALGTVVPWLMIGSHLLTENLAFPLYMWAIYAIVRCAAGAVAREAGRRARQ